MKLQTSCNFDLRDEQVDALVSNDQANEHGAVDKHGHFNTPQSNTTLSLFSLSLSRYQVHIVAIAFGKQDFSHLHSNKAKKKK
ncbi:hypothetical protein PsorP6_012169 [Peronosclerospora sorghi]|uniref:Uncharacterized protein n=1 Tax=Peronosclerospora sorghi TaxID=230839 RepID=A0ACC0WMW9_9STRA|nr:hypothetical protein PsorP6_012169 [Peronosclerospora sorghi]